MRKSPRARVDAILHCSTCMHVCEKSDASKPINPTLPLPHQRKKLAMYDFLYQRHGLLVH